jgi:hypothetical protein
MFAAISLTTLVLLCVGCTLWMHAQLTRMTSKYEAAKAHIRVLGEEVRSRRFSKSRPLLP